MNDIDYSCFVIAFLKPYLIKTSTMEEAVFSCLNHIIKPKMNENCGYAKKCGDLNFCISLRGKTKEWNIYLKIEQLSELYKKYVLYS